MNSAARGLPQPFPRGAAAGDRHELARCVEEIRNLLVRFAEEPERYVAPARLPGTSPNGAGTPPALRALADAFGLSTFAQGVILLAAATELDARVAAACGACQVDAGSVHPTFGLAMRLLPGGAWAEVLPGAPLRRWKLVTPGPGAALTRAPLRIDERILHFLCGFEAADERLRGVLRPADPGTDILPAARACADRIAAVWAPLLDGGQGGQAPIVNLFGNDRAGKVDVAAAACASLGMGLCCVSAEALPGGAAEQREIAELVDRESILTNSAVLVEVGDADAGRPELATAIGRLLDTLAAPVLVATSRRRPPGLRASIGIEVDRPPRAEQRALWGRALGATMGQAAAELAAAFDLGAREIRVAASAAKGRDGGRDPRATAQAAWELCRAEARPSLDDLARRVDARARWEDLVLAPRQMDQLRQIAAQLRHRSLVYDDWGLGRGENRGLAISALFAGASGTGKTMAAEVLASDLSLDLFHVDLSSVVSKYIGETEKNLGRIFDRAEGAGAILLFDEADALFGKRTEVKDSHDRNANLEVSYLLQRMEQYRGLAVLTSNLPDSLDPAFLRRLRFVVTFPFPGPESRKVLWTRVFPAGCPLRDVDFDKLAQLNASGGQIRNIALNAAFFAAADGEPVGMRHLLAATRIELEKAQRAPTAQEIRGWT